MQHDKIIIYEKRKGLSVLPGQDRRSNETHFRSSSNIYVPYRICERRIPLISKNEKIILSPLKTVDNMAIVPLHGWTGRQGGLVQSKRFTNGYWPDLSYWYSFVAKTISCTFRCVIRTYHHKSK